MNTISNLLFIIFSFSVCLMACSEGDTPLLIPSIEGFTPVSGSAGTEVTISGENLTSLPEDVNISFDGVEAQISSVNETEITVIVPDNADSGNLTISYGGTSQVLGEFTYLLSSIVLNKSEVSLKVMDRDTLKVITALNGREVSWSSADDNIVSVDEEGHLLALTTGTVEIMATVDGAVGVCVVDVSIEEVALNHVTINLEVGDQHMLEVTTEIGDESVSWESSNPETVSINESGNLKALASGSSTISAKVDGVSATCEVTVDLTIFAVGIEENSSGNEIAKLWKNGISSNFESSANLDSYSGGIAVSDDGEVKAAYASYDANSDSFKAKIWVDGVSTSLTNSIYAYPASTVIHGSDTYVLYTDEETTTNTVLWKNGNQTEITSDGYASAIHVDDNGTYVVYEEQNVDTRVAEVLLWKNGVKSNVTAGSSTSRANAIDVDGTDIFIAGSQYTGTHTAAVYWKNSTAVFPTTSSPNASMANDITVHNGDIYVVGNEKVSGTFVAKIWKNGAPTDLTDGTYSANAKAIFIHKEDIYVVGYEESGNDFTRVAMLWVNGVAQSLSDGSFNASLTDIYVK
ncbi:IPT/TIG domain-containing protein [Reichenbachiella sp.]|uniref:IPT/TIG domain-containing protein n=1 Tax=Reichenbachiella sp. TaxID=2184521 RepID=UPI003B58D9AD